MRVNRMAFATHESLEELVHISAEDRYLGYGLELGKIDKNLYDESIRIPGAFNNPHVHRGCIRSGQKLSDEKSHHSGHSERHGSLRYRSAWRPGA